MIDRCTTQARDPVRLQRADLLEGEFPQLPGGPILRCGLSFKTRALKQVRSEYDEALHRQDDAIPTLRLLADLASALHQPKLADERRRQADELVRC